MCALQIVPLLIVQPVQLQTYAQPVKLVTGLVVILLVGLNVPRIALLENATVLEHAEQECV